MAEVDREVTPWLVAAWHRPWYSTYAAHYREAECMRVEMEELLYHFGVDIVFSGHVSVLLILIQILCFQKLIEKKHFIFLTFVSSYLFSKDLKNLCIERQKPLNQNSGAFPV